MLGVADGVDLVDVVAHDFLASPTVTPARFSIILTMVVKSLSPPYSVLVGFPLIEHRAHHLVRDAERLRPPRRTAARP